MNERIALLRAEVEKRGMRWADAEVEDSRQLVNGDSLATSSASAVNSSAEQAPDRTGGGLTDQELMARLQERMQESEEEGVHL